MKVEFIIDCYHFVGEYGYTKELALSIHSKVNNTEIDLPFAPTKDMLVDLSYFGAPCGFTEEELDFLDNAILFEIDFMCITPFILTVYLKPHKEK